MQVCRCLPVDLTGQTSASYNMRLNYERCLLDFENYLACGQVCVWVLTICAVSGCILRVGWGERLAGEWLMRNGGIL